MSDRVPEERWIHIGLVLVGLLPVVGSLSRGGRVGAGLTICMLMIAIGTIGVVSDIWRARRAALPVARTRPRQTR